jgi:DNA-binding transcriptional LysR family regulator
MGRLGIVPRRRLQLPSYEAVVHALKSGYGIAAMNRCVVAEELRAGSLAVIAIRGWNVRSVLSALRARDARVTPLAEEFQSLVRKRFNEIAQERERKTVFKAAAIKSALGPESVMSARST